MAALGGILQRQIHFRATFGTEQGEGSGTGHQKEEVPLMR